MTVYHSLRDAQPPQNPSCVALGLFDGLHPGHQAVIDAAVRCAQKSGQTPCVFTFSIDDARPAAKPASGRLLSASLRDRLLADMGVEYVLCPGFCEFRGMTPEQYVHDILLGLFGATAVFCGDNFHFGKNAAGTPNDLRSLGAPLGMRVQTIPMVQAGGATVSSTRIRECIAAGDLLTARQLLGRPYAIDFEVIHGRRLGRTLNAPTINQHLPPWFAKPRFGVYASVVTVDSKRYIAVSNIGVKPTVGSDRVLAETCILDYSGDLYGRKVLVEFYEFIRPEQKFDSIDELRAQIARDAATARERIGQP